MTKDYVESILTSIGMQPGQRGFKYITDCVLLLEKSESFIKDWNSLYTVVGNINYTSPEAVEHAISNTLCFTRNMCLDFSGINRYLGFADTDNFSTILRLYHRLMSEYNRKSDAMLERILHKVISDLAVS